MWKALLVILVIFLAYNVVPSFNSYKEKAAANKENKPTKEIPKIKAHTWKTGGFKSILMVDFVIENKSSRRFKDIVVQCDALAKSGTSIDSNKRTIYEISEPGVDLKVKDFNMGFLHSQSDKVGCSIIDAVEM